MRRQRKKELLISHLSRTWTCELPSPGEKVAIFNTESLYYFFKCRNYREYVLSCDKIYIDGIGVKLVCLLKNLNLKRFNGPDLIALLERSQKGILVLGGSGNYKFPKNYVYNDLPYSNDVSLLSKHILNLLTKDRTRQYVLISLGLPKQELVSLKVLEKIHNSGLTLIPCGAAIDFNYGGKQRSSRIWRRLGLEFLPRLIKEPRMLPRIIRSLNGIAYTI